MKHEKQYIEQTEKLIEFYKDKKNNPVKEYIITCHNYISELRNLDAIEILDELEYQKLFNQVLNLVDETFRPNTFNSVLNGSNLRLLDSEFIIYILSVQNSLKKPLKWKLLIELNYNFSLLEIRYKIKTKFEQDFTQYAIKNITLSDLWKISIS